MPAIPPIGMTMLKKIITNGNKIAQNGRSIAKMRLNKFPNINVPQPRSENS